ncbi:winged helix-turn-helix domain-containing protein [Halobaculum sp. MBLA0147]|uniref:winged helix-turn-helix domain-containing protein n=1 Tax=Halobaculum sp. MBLA0147 TaxID=3079934 RepID=UPI0035237395
MKSNIQPDEHSEPLDEGDVCAFTDSVLFGGTVDSLDAHVERKRALADPFRYSVLYLTFLYGRVSRSRLVEETGRDSNDLQHHLKRLLETNLLAEVPAPDDADGRRTYYRITTMGKQAIGSDLSRLTDEQNAAEKQWRSFADPAFVETDDTEGRRRVAVSTANDAEDLKQMQEYLARAGRGLDTSTSER